jgi:hypothetical protein
MSPMSAEATVVRNYIDWLLSMPWKKKTKIKQGPQAPREEILDEDHYGLEKVKERIVEYLAVQQRVDKLKGRSCAWSARPASARPRSASRSRGDRPQVRAHVARRRARRGRDPRPPPHLHRLDARQDHAER